MIPDGLAAVLSFLLFIAPGILYELQRERYLPSAKTSAFMEISRLVLASLVFTVLSATLLLWWLWKPLYEAAPAKEVFESPVTLVPYVGAVLVNSMLSCALVLISSFFRWRGPAPIANMNTWHRAFIEYAPLGCPRPYLIVDLVDDTAWRGSLLSFDSNSEDAERCLVLGSPLVRRRPGQEKGFPPKYSQVVLLPEAQIKSIQVAYPPG